MTLRKWQEVGHLCEKHSAVKNVKKLILAWVWEGLCRRAVNDRRAQRPHAADFRSTTPAVGYRLTGNYGNSDQ
jgi:hypothetical protein